MSEEKQYIITEEQLKELVDFSGQYGSYLDALELGRKIRSHPHSNVQSEPVQCPHWLIGRVTGIDGDTNEYFCNAQSERENVLEKLTNRIHKKQNEIPAGSMYGGLVWVMGEILELRKGGEE